MSPRLVLEIALRVMGLWFFFTGISTLTTTVSVLLWTPSGSMRSIWLYFVATVVVQFLLGGVLVFCAPAIAAWFYPAGNESDSPRAVGPGDLYRAACFVLGAYLLVAASQPAGRLLDAVNSSGAFGPSAAGDAVTLIVHVAAGLLLVFGSRRIADLLANLRYDPSTIPNQQLSLAMLLILIVLVAVALGVFRMISVGP